MAAEQGGSTVALVQFDRARHALAVASSIDEVKQIRDQAEAMRLYFRQAEQGLEMQNQCAAIKLRAEQRGGEMLADMEKHPAGRPPNNPLDARTDLPPTLSDLGISRFQSHRWQKVADIPREFFEDHLADVAEKGELTTAGLLRDWNMERRRERGEAPPPALPVGVFPTIVADPPWQYEDSTVRGAAERHYKVLSIDDIGLLPVGERAADSAHLYLWVTNPMLPDVWDVIESWGFEYKTLLTWVKPQIGTGRYFRGATEHVAFCTRGNLPLRDRGLRNWFEADRTVHSKKPEQFYALVERASHGPYLELFARDQREGWESWGDEL